MVTQALPWLYRRFPIDKQRVICPLKLRNSVDALSKGRKKEAFRAKNTILLPEDRIRPGTCLLPFRSKNHYESTCFSQT